MADAQSNPTHHTQKVKSEMNALIAHLREDVNKVDDPKFKAMFETSAEVIGGLVKAFSDYERRSEATWRQ